MQRARGEDQAGVDRGSLELRGTPAKPGRHPARRTSGPPRVTRSGRRSASVAAASLSTSTPARWARTSCPALARSRTTWARTIATAPHGPASCPRSPSGSPGPRRVHGCARAAGSRRATRAGARGPLSRRPRAPRPHQFSEAPAGHPRLVNAFDLVDQGQRPLGDQRAHGRLASERGRASCASSDCMRSRAPAHRGACATVASARAPAPPIATRTAPVLAFGQSVRRTIGRQCAVRAARSQPIAGALGSEGMQFPPGRGDAFILSPSGPLVAGGSAEEFESSIQAIYKSGYRHLIADLHDVHPDRQCWGSGPSCAG